MLFIDVVHGVRMKISEKKMYVCLVKITFSLYKKLPVPEMLYVYEYFNLHPVYCRYNRCKYVIIRVDSFTQRKATRKMKDRFFMG